MRHVREARRPAPKGVVWLVVAVGVLLLVEVLIFSMFFSELTLQKRELTDATIVYEGSELEVFARSIDNSIELSMAQGMYDFYVSYRGAVWNYYGQNTMPDDAAIASQVQSKAAGYVKDFIGAHVNFDEQDDIRGLSWDGAGSTFKLEKNFARMELPSMTLEKSIDSLFTGTYKRTFVPESTITTVFGDMVAYIREKFIANDVIKDSAMMGIGYPSAAKTEAETCGQDYRGKNPEKTLNAHIDQRTSCTTGSGEPENRQCFKTGQTGTVGRYDYCSFEKSSIQCAPSNPCPNTGGIVGPRSDPPPVEVYPPSHISTFADAAANIKAFSEKRLLCLEGEMDAGKDKYTVAFDGDSFEENLDAYSIETEGAVTGSCSYPLANRECGGQKLSMCGVTASGTVLYDYQCYKAKKAVCNYEHYVKADVSVRVQEDGFVYGLWDGSKSKAVADSLKLVFKVTTGNGQGVIN